MKSSRASGIGKIAILGIVVLGLIIAIGAYFAKSYNKMVALDEKVQNAWGQVENVYQRRADLIPNLVATVKGYATHEQETLPQVMEARAKATQTTLNADNLTPEALERFSKVQGELSGALTRLMAVSENYPTLKANENFIMLQTQLEGTENRISVERKRFNDVAKEYNGFIRSFPTNIVAGFFDFEKRAYFEASEEAKTAPKIEF